jgi:hypothetical protein
LFYPIDTGLLRAIALLYPLHSIIKQEIKQEKTVHFSAREKNVRFYGIFYFFGLIAIGRTPFGIGGT